MESAFPSRCPQPRPPASSPVQVSPPESESKDAGREHVEPPQPPEPGAPSSPRLWGVNWSSVPTKGMLAAPSSPLIPSQLHSV